MLVQAQHRFRVEEYHRMAETGILPPDARIELLDGKIIDMSPIGPFHGGVTKRLNRFFSRTANGRWIVAVQDPVRLDDYSEPEPDLMLLKPSLGDYTDHHPTAADVFLLIEVAVSSLDYDGGDKLRAYARSGISEVWIVDLVERSVEVFRDPHLSGY